jgi:predicted PurR-regulated permease PerM
LAVDPTSALLFRGDVVRVERVDNLLRPVVGGRGLNTAMLVGLIGVIGGTLAYGISGLFLGPIVLAVIWELMVAWIKEHETE